MKSYVRLFLFRMRNVSDKICKENQHTRVIFIVEKCILKIHWILHTNKCINCISYISVKLFTRKHLIYSYMFR